jgi:molybdate transport system substrate-binding protein
MAQMHQRTVRDLQRRAVAVVAIILVAAGSAAQAAELRVVSSGGFASAYRELVPEFERSTGNTVTTEWGPSMGDTPQAIPQRLARGEPIDVVIMVGDALDQLVKSGKALPDSRMDLARSLIGAAVKAGAPKPDLSTVEAVKRTLLEAPSIAYSDSASGVYISTEMFARLGIADQVKSKARMIPATPVGEIVARGEAALGFQQVSELLPVPGITFAGTLPPELQKVTLFSAGVVTGSKNRAAAAALIQFLASRAAADAITRSGLEPVIVGGR